MEGGRIPKWAQREQSCCQRVSDTHWRVKRRLLTVAKGAEVSRLKGPIRATDGFARGILSDHEMYLSEARVWLGRKRT